MNNRLKYFIDTEFIENGSTIELISIGIVCEDGRTFYAINNDCDLSSANDWVKDNVIKQLPRKNGSFGSLWKTKRQIADDVKDFCNPVAYGKPQFWAYYGDYDWVVFCQLFGTMLQLPDNYPMYCMDLKQWCVQLGDPELPKQDVGIHDAFADACWNRAVWDFLNKLSLDCDVETIEQINR